MYPKNHEMAKKLGWLKNRGGKSGLSEPEKRKKIKEKKLKS